MHLVCWMMTFSNEKSYIFKKVNSNWIIFGLAILHHAYRIFSFWNFIFCFVITNESIKIFKRFIVWLTSHYHRLSKTLEDGPFLWLMNLKAIRHSNMSNIMRYNCIINVIKRCHTWWILKFCSSSYLLSSLSLLKKTNTFSLFKPQVRLNQIWRQNILGYTISNLSRIHKKNCKIIW